MKPPNDPAVEFAELLDSQQFDIASMSDAILESHIRQLEHLSRISGSAITLFDHYRRRHVFASANHRELLGCTPTEEGDTDLRVHPEDLPHIARNGVACMKHFFVGNKNAFDHKLVREYRVEIRGAYKKVTEQIKPLEADSRGNIWLVLCIMDISPDQTPPYHVNTKLINCRTGDVITPVEAPHGNKPLLSAREVAVLSLIDEGRLSKEIAEKLCISIHTVNTHRQRILEKLRVDTSIEAIRYAMALGLLEN